VLYNNIFTYGLIVITLVLIMIIWLEINKFNIQKSVIILFFLTIPFFADINVLRMEDFHIVAKPFYRFNYIHIFAIYFFEQIIANHKKIKINKDLIIIFIFNLICILSIVRAINIRAAFYDYLRYVILSIIYIYFSRIFNYEKYKVIMIKCLIWGVCFQLILGIIQMIKGGSVGLSIIGEVNDVFRLGVEGYEKGFSGTFTHPGPIALYANFMLIFFLYSNDKNKVIKKIGVIVSSLIILLAAGRTSIMLMILVYLLYNFGQLITLNKKAVKMVVFSMLFLIMIVMVFNEAISPVISRFIESDMSKQYENRMEHIEIGFKYIKRNPVIGVGLNNFLDNTLRDNPFDFARRFNLWNPIHNMFILYAVEIGILGLLILCLFIFNNLKYYNKIKLICSYNEGIEIKGYLVVILVWCIYGFQGWGGIQMRSILIVFLSCSFISNIYYRKIDDKAEKVKGII